MPHRPMNREQIWMLPPSLDEMLEAGHPARFAAEFVDALDDDGWTAIGVDKDGEPMGAPAYHPRVLLGVWLYGFMTRAVEPQAGGGLPRPDTVPLADGLPATGPRLWRFYNRHRDGMRKLLKRTVQTAVKMDLMELAVQAVDGTKVRANASKDRTYDAGGLRRLLGRLEGG